MINYKFRNALKRNARAILEKLKAAGLDVSEYEKLLPEIEAPFIKERRKGGCTASAPKS